MRDIHLLVVADSPCQNLVSSALSLTVPRRDGTSKLRGLGAIAKPGLDSTGSTRVSSATSHRDRRAAMPRSISDLFDDFRDGTITRRQLFQALAAAAVT